MPTILMVCTANICRSPVAEVLLRERLRVHGFSDWQVVSGGFLADGYGAAKGSSDVLAERHGLHLEDHCSQRLTLNALDSADLVLCMERRHVEGVFQLLGEGLNRRSHRRVFRLAEMAGEERDVEDPHGGPRAGYEQMVHEVDDLLARGFQRIVELAQVAVSQRRAGDKKPAVT